MYKSSEPAGHISRRDVLGTVGASAIAAAFSSTISENTEAFAQSSTQPGVLRPVRELRADVVVVGGGMAGVCAALAAARNGASVVLVQDRPVLGGNSSSEIRVGVGGADGGGVKNTDVRESGIIEELRLGRTVNGYNLSASMWDLLLYDKIRSEPSINLLLNTACREVTRKTNDRIEEILAWCPTSESAVRIRGSLFIDCTGDGTLGALAGADFRMGREGRDEFNESIAPPEPDNKLLGSSILFSTREYDQPMPFVAPAWARRFPTCEDLPHRPHDTWSFGFWWIEYGGQLNTIHDNERIRGELMAVAMGVWDHIKNSGRHPSSANWALEWIGFVPGKRESRRLMGDYILKQRDVETGQTFHDGWLMAVGLLICTIPRAS